MQLKRTYIVTGGNTGLGLECVRNLAKFKNSTTIVACRNLESGEAAVGDIRRSGVDVRVMHLDLSSLGSVRSFVDDFKKLNGLSLGAMVCNAGLQEVGKPSRTQDGFETTFGVNYLGHFFLTQLLLSVLEPSGRIILVSSGTHDPAEKTGMPAPVYTNAEQLAGDLTPGAENGRRRYSTSKLLMIYYMHELTRRLEMSNDPHLNSIRANTFDPGLMPGTGLARQYAAPVRFLWNYVLPILVYFHKNVHTPKTSGKRLAQIAADPSLNGTNQYFSDGKEKRSSVLSYNLENEKDLWNMSLKLTSLSGW